MTDHLLYNCGGKGHGSDVSEVQWCRDCTPPAPVEFIPLYGAHPLTTQAYFLTGYLAPAAPHVRQHLRDLIRGVGIAMPPTVDEDGIATPARIWDQGTPEPEFDTRWYDRLSSVVASPPSRPSRLPWWGELTVIYVVSIGGGIAIAALISWLWL